MECPVCNGIGRKLKHMGDGVMKPFTYWKKCWLCKGTTKMPELFNFVKRCMLRYGPILFIIIVLILLLYF